MYMGGGRGVHGRGLDCDEVLYDGLRRGVGAIVDEIHMHGTDVDRECLDYCLNQRAGSSALVFSNSPYPRDCDEHGVRPE